MAIALALDPRERYRTAREMGRAMSDAQRGIAPVEPGGGGHAASGHRGHLAARRGQRGSGRGRGDARSQPHAPARRGGRRSSAAARTRSARAEPIVAAPDRRRLSRGRRLFATLFALLLLVVVVVALIVATAPAPTKVTLRNVVYSDVEQTSAALQELVRENTR